MNLSPEERAIGKENFHAVIGSDFTGTERTSRREFLKAAIAAGIAAKGGLEAYCFGYEPIQQPVRVGVIGTGDQGGVLIGAMNPEFLAVKAVSDIRPYNIYRAFHGDSGSDLALTVRCGLMTKYGWKTEDEARRHVRVCDDYRDLIADASIEAVIIALPLHLHAPVAVAAMKAGKHVLVEKTMAQSVHECKEMARVAKAMGLHLATGYQRHYNVVYDNTVDLIRRGVLGEVHHIRAQWHRYNMPGRDSWQQPLPPGTKPDDPLAGKLSQRLIGYQRSLARAQGAATDRWQRRVAQLEAQIADRAVDAEKHGYRRNQIRSGEGEVIYDCPPLEELIRWRLWNRTSGGLMSELGGHQIDAVGLLLSATRKDGPVYPVSISASSARPIFPPDREMDDHFYCTIEFPSPDYDSRDLHARRKRIGMQYSTINGNGFGGYGETVLGTEGTLIIERELDAMLFRKYSTKDRVRVTDATTGPTILRDERGDPASAAVGNMATADASRGYAEQMEHWAWCIRNPAPENQPRCHPQVTIANAVVSLTARIAAKQRQQIDFVEQWFDPDSDETPEGVRPDVQRYS